MDEHTTDAAARAQVPAEIARSEPFRRWLDSQLAAGNTLEYAEVLWALRAAGGDSDFFAMRVEVLVTAEDRVKANEVVLSRPDVSAVALYVPAPVLDETIVVLVREFRSPVRTADGFVHELPGGSGGSADPRAQAVAELWEEVGLGIDPARLRSHGSRQPLATQSTHHVFLYSAEITAAELADLRLDPGPRGAGETERTWIEIAPFGEIRSQRLVDWSTLGMLAQVLLDR